MNIRQFFDKVAGYDFDTVYRLSTTAIVTGDWLPWFRLDLASHIVSECDPVPGMVDLTASYPGSGDGCGLLIKGPSEGERTYIELVHQYARNVRQALDAFKQIVEKQYRHTDVAGFCLLSSIGPWQEADIKALDLLSKNSGVSDYCLLGTDNNGNDFVKSKDEIERSDYQLENYYYLIGFSVSQVNG